ncbi:MAG TPA: DUF4290 domain-containing protein [Bacteroidia bacterium]|nr:DUF4290 domain-containing protein [Bacteroidia bacterium]
MNQLPEYNTVRNHLVFSEYGRNVQKLVEYLGNIKDRNERNRKAHTVIAIMGNLNPHLRDTADYKHKLWDHLFAMSNFTLDIDSPYPLPTAEILNKKPDRVPYLGNHIKFRFYGRNVQSMVKKAAEMEDGEAKQYFINMIASFLRNSGKNWNEENLSAEAIADHLEVLSEGKIKVRPEELTLSEVARHQGSYRPNNNQRNFKGNNRNNFKNRNQKQQQHKRNKY